jgi:hypothetical protein
LKPFKSCYAPIEVVNEQHNGLAHLGEDPMKMFGKIFHRIGASIQKRFRRSAGIKGGEARHENRQLPSTLAEQVTLRYQLVAEAGPLLLELVKGVLSGLTKLSLTVDATLDGDIRDAVEESCCGVAAPVGNTLVRASPGPQVCLRNEVRALGDRHVAAA